MNDLTFIVLVGLSLYLFYDLVKNWSILSGTKAIVLSLIHLMFSLTVIVLAVNKSLCIAYYPLLLLPLAILSAIYQFLRFKTSKADQIKRYNLMFMNYLFIATILVLFKYV